MLVKPLEMPFKIGDVIVLWSEKQSYCFVNPPEEIKKDLANKTGIEITEKIELSENFI